MNKAKRFIACMAMMILVFSNSLMASAATEATCAHNTIAVYEKNENYSEYWFWHTEQHGSTSVSCDVYKVYYTVRWKCTDCGEMTLVTTETGDRHGYR